MSNDIMHPLHLLTFPSRFLPLVSLFQEEAGQDGGDPVEREIMYDGEQLWISFYADSYEERLCNELVVRFEDKKITVSRSLFIHEEKTSCYMGHLIRCLEKISPGSSIIFENLFNDKQRCFCLSMGYLFDPLNEGRMLPVELYHATYGEISYEDHFLLSIMNRYMGWRRLLLLLKKWRWVCGILREFNIEGKGI